jgi:hypothetical protein
MSNYSFRYSFDAPLMQTTDVAATFAARSVDELVAAFSDRVLAQLGERFGLAPQILGGLTRRTATIITIALTSRCIEPHQALLDAVMSPVVKARAHELLVELTETTMAMKKLEGEGLASLAAALQCEPASLSDIVSERTGVPAQAAHAWTGIVAAVFLAQLKRQVLLDQDRDTGGIQRHLLSQWPAVSGQADEALGVALGFEGRDALVAAIAGAHDKMLRQVPLGVVSIQPDGAAGALVEMHPSASASSWRGLAIGCVLGALTGASGLYGLAYEGVVPVLKSQPAAAERVRAVTIPPMVATAIVANATSARSVASAASMTTAPASSGAVIEAASNARPESPPMSVPSVSSSMPGR